MDVYSVLQQLLRKAISIEMISSEDEVYARNQIMSLLALNEFRCDEPSEPNKDIPDLLDELTDYAVGKGIIDDLLDEREILSSQIMNVFMPRPSDLNQIFYEKYEEPENATSYFYELSRNSNYIQTKRISKNINYKADTKYGELDITINLSKPEKDPRQIAKEREKKDLSINYPKCLLCVENEGYAGRIGHPARSNHRMIRMDLGGEPWFLQYSPYVYYNEHCILLAGEHRDMVINREAFERLLEFVEKFPHYFIGSNADLPIVGGSILVHDHYQGGNYHFAMAKARDEYSFTLDSFPTIKASTIKWPMSVIRLRGLDKEKLVAASDYILGKWKNYSDREANIFAYSGETRHNTITPIVRMRNGEFEVDLVLRNNRTSDEHPMGIFHPHADVHHIKKENIGLIEVMGLAVLPARLKTELAEVEKFLLEEPNQIEEYHVSWAEDIKARSSTGISGKSMQEIVRKEVALKFLKALEDAGVYKRNGDGQAAFRRFLDSL
ncbi:UDP-glucose--hexose-1-phosphate uridylyltransferase [Bacillus canaveralius]|uniref:Galactose-1-phosphate uridylyltransferase n=1 Tax=Bacillus canaveralius TaxID=1403243 RepID=A0A2N5GSY5_9BACI|nr:UDP-glucose--hexose-1-phosphate uridylyltransferase [Bacillus canaveralius]PLR86880.1 UDP-glucose--hexose-1-phosphate uridylyltransferase [Bacillus canaveralius]PLR93368.1 UDP-glucose--hexose-1-phosphate uridylyltransferase [Bacillus canaveralius]